MDIRDLDFELPAELIAQHPLAERDASRMMVVDRRGGAIRHAAFRDLPSWLEPGDRLVLNDAKVVPARIWGRRGEAVIEFLFLKPLAPDRWEALCRPARRLRAGDTVVFPGGLEARVAEERGEGRRGLVFGVPDVPARLKEIGFAPLPPYIKRRKADLRERPRDLERYQTVFAAREGAIAAPTAGLHFTPPLLDRIRERRTAVVRITLHVGLATFQPLRVRRLEDHRMLEEAFEIGAEAAGEINRAKDEGLRVTAVGTTVVRALESAGGDGRVRAGAGTTSIFIRPGFSFRIVDRLLTNFHLPKSTLLALVSAFAGVDLIRAAYAEAVRERYRFFSYGDCMLIV